MITTIDEVAGLIAQSAVDDWADKNLTSSIDSGSDDRDLIETEIRQ